jgi:hypothetical protein
MAVRSSRCRGTPACHLSDNSIPLCGSIPYNTKLTERGGFEPPVSCEEVCNKSKSCGSVKNPLSVGLSVKDGNDCVNLNSLPKVVQSLLQDWDSLQPEIQLAILTLVKALKGGAGK